MIVPWSPILQTVKGIFEYQRIVQGSIIRENNTLHVMDNQSRIAVVSVGAPVPDDTTPAAKFHLGDHLGGSSLVLDDTGALVNREEYTPHVDTSFGSFAMKRYRFTGKERDEESGLYYHGGALLCAGVGEVGERSEKFPREWCQCKIQIGEIGAKLPHRYGLWEISYS